MADYGFEVPTTNGLMDIAAIRALRLKRKFNITGEQGQVTISPALGSTSTIFVRPLDGSPPPILILNGNELTWTKRASGASSSNMDILVLEFA